MTDPAYKSKTDIDQPTYLPRRRQNALLCPTGLALAFFAHVLLFASASLMAMHFTAYALSATGYATLCVILGSKVWGLRQHARQCPKRLSQRESWTSEYESRGE